MCGLKAQYTFGGEECGVRMWCLKISRLDFNRLICILIRVKCLFQNPEEFHDEVPAFLNGGDFQFFIGGVNAAEGWAEGDHI